MFLAQETRWDDVRIVLQNAAPVFEQGEHHAEQATCLNNIGTIYKLQGQLDTALDYHQHALALDEQVGNPVVIARSCHYIAYLRLQQEQWQDATPLSIRALRLYERMGRGFESHVADELEMLAVCYLKLGESEKGVPYYMRAKQIREQLQKSETA